MRKVEEDDQKVKNRVGEDAIVRSLNAAWSALLRTSANELHVRPYEGVWGTGGIAHFPRVSPSHSCWLYAC
jgi:hypothetical protein